MKTNYATPEEFLSDLERDPMKRHQITLGYASHMALRERSLVQEGRADELALNRQSIKAVGDSGFEAVNIKRLLESYDRRITQLSAPSYTEASVEAHNDR